MLDKSSIKSLPTFTRMIRQETDMCANKQDITKVPTEGIRLKCEEKHINKLKSLIWEPSEGEEQLPELGADKTMSNSVSHVATSKTAATSFVSKSRPSAPMVTYCPDMRESDCIAILLRGRPVPRDELIHSRAINIAANSHKDLALEIGLDRKAIEFLIYFRISLFLTKVGNVIQGKVANEVLKATTNRLNAGATQKLIVKELKNKLIGSEQTRNIMMTCKDIMRCFVSNADTRGKRQVGQINGLSRHPNGFDILDHRWMKGISWASS